MDTSMARDLISAARHYIRQHEKEQTAGGSSTIVKALDELANAIEAIVDRIND